MRPASWGRTGGAAEDRWVQGRQGPSRPSARAAAGARAAQRPASPIRGAGAGDGHHGGARRVDGCRGSARPGKGGSQRAGCLSRGAAGPSHPLGRSGSGSAAFGVSPQPGRTGQRAGSVGRSQPVRPVSLCNRGYAHPLRQGTPPPHADKPRFASATEARGGRPALVPACLTQLNISAEQEECGFGLILREETILWASHAQKRRQLCPLVSCPLFFLFFFLAKEMLTEITVTTTRHRVQPQTPRPGPASRVWPSPASPRPHGAEAPAALWRLPLCLRLAAFSDL